MRPAGAFFISAKSDQALALEADGAEMKKGRAQRGHIALLFD
jgi:hypothetical protein